jgi:hypothetical protein
VLAIRGWWWLTFRFPRTMLVVILMIGGLLRGSRRR